MTAFQLPLIAALLAVLTTSCRKDDASTQNLKIARMPSVMLRLDPASNRILRATVLNPSDREIVIPGFDDDWIYGSYWYSGDEHVKSPDCGTGFWDSVIRVPPGQSRELRLPVPREALAAKSYTVAIVYGGVGKSIDDAAGKEPSSDSWLRNPDIFLRCRKMETVVTLPAEGSGTHGE